VVAQVAGRLAARSRVPEKAEKDIVQHLDASNSVFAPDQQPSQHADGYTDGGDGQVRLLHAATMRVSTCRLSHDLYETILSDRQLTLHSRRMAPVGASCSLRRSILFRAGRSSSPSRLRQPRARSESGVGKRQMRVIGKLQR
jgi:hypothetical protein